MGAARAPPTLSAPSACSMRSPPPSDEAREAIVCSMRLLTCLVRALLATYSSRALALMGLRSRSERGVEPSDGLPESARAVRALCAWARECARAI